MLHFYIELQQSTSYNFRKDGTMEKHLMSSLEITLYQGSVHQISDSFIKRLIQKYNVAIESQTVVDYNDNGEYKVISIHDIPPGGEETCLDMMFEELGVMGIEYQYTEELPRLNSGAEQYIWKQGFI